MSEQNTPISGTPVNVQPPAGGNGITSDMFVDQSETAVATIGNNLVQNVVTGKNLQIGFATLTQKRLYYKGVGFSAPTAGGAVQIKNGNLVTTECVVPVEDITTTRFTHIDPTGKKLQGILYTALGAIFFLMGMMMMMKDSTAITIMFTAFGGVLLFFGIIPLIQAFIGKQTMFQISFPGGTFNFDVKLYPIADMRDFQRQLHLIKDHIKENA